MMPKESNAQLSEPQRADLNVHVHANFPAMPSIHLQRGSRQLQLVGN